MQTLTKNTHLHKIAHIRTKQKKTIPKSWEALQNISKAECGNFLIIFDIYSIFKKYKDNIFNILPHQLYSVL